jgi:predicted AAA+ superfamily ATPase
MDRPSRPRTLTRHAAASVATALADTRAVALAGPRQAGKSTLVRSIVEKSKGAVYLPPDDDDTRAQALADPAGFVRGRSGLLAIDEVQRVPGLLLGVKSVVDADPRTGRFLLSGSAHLFAVPIRPT